MGSTRGHTRDTSLFLHARDTRPLDGPGSVNSSGSCLANQGVADCALNKLREAVQACTPKASHFACIRSKTLGKLRKEVQDAISAFECKNYSEARREIEDVNEIVLGNLASFFELRPARGAGAAVPGPLPHLQAREARGPPLNCSRCGEPNAAERVECVRCGEVILDAEATDIRAPESGSATSAPTASGGVPTVVAPPTSPGGEIPSQLTFSMHGLSSSSPGGGTSERTLGGVFAGRYEILGILGEGSMGRVYKARDRELDKVVALKTLRTEGDPDAVLRLKQELVLSRRITHKNVVRIHDLGEAEGIKFFTMEYIEGDSLKAFIRRRGALPPGDAIALSRQILGALGEAHAQGVVHRDMKPQNIMVDLSGSAHLMDFGIARAADVTGLTVTGTVTPDYMSPEQVRGRAAPPTSSPSA